MSRGHRRARRGGPLYLTFGIVIVITILIAVLPGSRGPVIIVYGDSLTVQSEDAVHQTESDPTYPVVFRAYGGTALCDAVKHAAKDRLDLQPERIVLAFTGNTATCAHDTYVSGGVAATVALYEKSLRQMRAIYPEVPITIVIPPAMHDRVGWYPFNGNSQLVAMYKRVGAELHMYINTDADSWLTPGHVYAQDRPDMTTGKLVDVRLSDGIHLTPAGARWYAAALIEQQTGDHARQKAKMRAVAG